jgi:glutamyl-tRNA reductase
VNINNFFLVIFLFSVNSIHAAVNNDDKQTQNNHDEKLEIVQVIAQEFNQAVNQDPFLENIAALTQRANGLNLAGIRALYQRAQAGDQEAQGTLIGLHLTLEEGVIINDNPEENQMIRDILNQY